MVRTQDIQQFLSVPLEHLLPFSCQGKYRLWQAWGACAFLVSSCDGPVRFDDRNLLAIDAVRFDEGKVRALKCNEVSGFDLFDQYDLFWCQTSVPSDVSKNLVDDGLFEDLWETVLQDGQLEYLGLVRRQVR